MALSTHIIGTVDQQQTEINPPSGARGPKKIVIAGGTGYLGSVLVSHFKSKCKEIIILSREDGKSYENVLFVKYNTITYSGWGEELEGADVLINLAGKNVNCRYNEKNKKEILESRLGSTRILGEAVRSCKNPPKVWIQGASATIYRHAEDRAMDEETGEIGEGFSVEVCKQWENCFWEQDLQKTRKVLMRIGIILGRKGGAFPYYYNLAKTGLGGKHGSGKQMISWLHEEDFAKMVAYFITNSGTEGVYNCTAPDPVSNAEFLKELRKQLKMPVGIPSPAWLLEMGALLMQTETELMLKSRWVVSARLLKEGFDFNHPGIEGAIRTLTKSI